MRSHLHAHIMHTFNERLKEFVESARMCKITIIQVIYFQCFYYQFYQMRVIASQTCQIIPPPYFSKNWRLSKNTNSVNRDQKQFNFSKIIGAFWKQIVYLESAKIGDSSGILFISIYIYIKIKKSNIFFFLYFLSITIIFNFLFLRIKCSCIPIHRHQIFWEQKSFNGMREDLKITANYFWTDFSYYSISRNFSVVFDHHLLPVFSFWVFDFHERNSSINKKFYGEIFKIKIKINFVKCCHGRKRRPSI